MNNINMYIEAYWQYYVILLFLFLLLLLFVIVMVCFRVDPGF